MHAVQIACGKKLIFAKAKPEEFPNLKYLYAVAFFGISSVHVAPQWRLFWQDLLDASESIRIFMDSWKQSGSIFILILAFHSPKLQKDLPTVSVGEVHPPVYPVWQWKTTE